MNLKCIETDPSPEEIIPNASAPTNDEQKLELKIVSSELRPWTNRNPTPPKQGQRSYYCDYPTDNNQRGEEAPREKLTQHFISRNLGNSNLDALEETSSLEEIKLKALSGLTEANNYATEESKKTKPNSTIIKCASRAFDDFQKVVNLLDSTALNATNSQQKIKSEQARYFYLAGNALLKGIREACKSEPIKGATDFFATAASYYERGCDQLEKNTNNIPSALYHFQAGSAYEEAAQEMQDPSPYSQKVLQYFNQSAVSFSQAVLWALDANIKEAKPLASAGKAYLSLAQEYQKEEPQQDIINKYLAKIETEQQKLSEAIKRKFDK